MSIAQKLTIIAENMPKVYEAGKSAGNGGYEQGYEDGYAKGEMPIYYAQSIRDTWRGVEFPENTNIVLRFKKAPNLIRSAFMYAKNIKSVKLISEENSDICNLYELVRETDIEILDLTEFDRTITGATSMCYMASKLKSVLGALDFSGADNLENTFKHIATLEDIEFVPNTIKLNISFNSSRLLTDKSIQSIIDGLADFTGQTTQTLTFHETVGAKLTDTQKATITAKNWTLVY